MTRNARVVGLAVFVAIVLGTAFVLFARGSVVDPATLDSIRAARVPQGILIVGAWEAPGGRVLNAADHETIDGVVHVRLYARALVNGRLETDRRFMVLVPIVRGSPTRIVVEGGDRPLELAVLDDAPPAAGVQVRSRPRP